MVLSSSASPAATAAQPNQRGDSGAATWETGAMNWIKIRHAAAFIAIAMSAGATDLAKAGAATPTTRPAVVTTAPGPNVDGRWIVGARSVAGYRIMERLVQGLSKTEAAGRTEKITGSLSIGRTTRNLTVRDVSISVDTPSLASGDSRRDAKMRTEGLETDKFPTATFETTSAIAVPFEVLRGRDVTVKAKGRLTLHGVTRSVEVQIAAGVRGSGLEMVASAPIVLADYGISPPSNAFVTVDDNGTFEVKLVLVRP